MEIGTKHKSNNSVISGTGASTGRGTGTGVSNSNSNSAASLANIDESNTATNMSTSPLNSIPKPTPRNSSNSNSKNIISRTVTSAMNNNNDNNNGNINNNSNNNNNNLEIPHLKLSNKLRHTSSNYGLSNISTNFDPKSDRLNSGNINSPSSISFSRSPKTSKPRVSSKSSGISVTVDLPTIRPGSGLKKQRNLSRINTLFGDEINRSYSSSSSDESDSDYEGRSRCNSSGSSSDSSSKLDKKNNNNNNNNDNNNGNNNKSIVGSNGKSDNLGDHHNHYHHHIFDETEEDHEEAEAELVVALSKEDVAPDKNTGHHRRDLNEKSGVNFIPYSINPSTNKSKTIDNETESESESENEHENDNEGYLQIDKKKLESDTIQRKNISNPKSEISKNNINGNRLNNDTSELFEKDLDNSKSFKHSMSSSNNAKESNFYLSETTDLLNHRIKLLDDLHLNPASSEALINISKSDDNDNNDNDDYNKRSPSSEDIPQSQTMKPSLSDMSVLTSMSNSKVLKSKKESIDLKKYETLNLNNHPIEMSEALFEKHPTMSMKHYMKILNRAKHAGAYLSTYYGVIEEYQVIRHPNSKNGESIYANVDGIWNPLQIMRNRRVRMHTGEKLKKFTMHGQKVGVGELYNNNGSLSNLATTSSIPLETVITHLENPGLGINSSSDQDCFQYDWKKVKIASRVFSKHEKQRLIWQIGLHEIIGDLVWREGKWNELRNPNGKRWFPKYSIEMHNHRHTGSDGVYHHKISEDPFDDDYGDEHKIHRIHNLLFEDESIVSSNFEKNSNGKKIKKYEEDHSSSSGSAGSSEKKHKRMNLKEVAKIKLRDREKKDKEKDKEREKEKEKEHNDREKNKDHHDDKERSGSIRKKSDNLASRYRFDHYNKKSISAGTPSPAKNVDMVNMPVIKIEKTPNTTSFEDNIFNSTGLNSNSNSASMNSKGERCSSVVSDVNYYDALDEVVEFMHLTRSIDGYIERNKYDMITKECDVYEQLKKNRDKLTSKIEDIEKLENQSMMKHAILLEMVEEVEIKVEKHRAFTGIRANKIEELLGYCDRTNGEVNTSLALKIRNLNERADAISIQSEDKVLFECIYKIAEASIVGLLWMIWIIVELWLWCKWSVKKAVGVVKWVLI
ncbi:hypothetical protein C6P40_002360 [Pichia californica]|uniref:Maintenance of telomere capping protein 4 n=1 Tax=Pichia californica TaxID=460514 RepID=A0A9P7BCX1_9ASCO|nr:hypothetical protein C6P40_002360 [[Candida] californica]